MNDFESVIKKYEKQTEDLHKRNDSSLENSLRVANETKELSNAILVDLHGQTEQLNRIDNSLDQAEENTDLSGKILKHMKSWTGVVTTFIPGLGPSFSKKERPSSSSKGKQSQIKVDQSGVRDARARSEAPKSATGSSKGGRQELLGGRMPNEKARAATDPIGREEDKLDQLSSILGDLKAAGNLMGRELDVQKNMMDPMEAKVDRISSKTKKNTTMTHQLM